MPTAKPRYKGDGAGMLIPDFSDALRNKLREFYPDKEVTPDLHLGNPTDDFVNGILAETWWAKSELFWQDFGCTKQEIRAEHSDLLKCLRNCEEKLRNLSPDFDRLLGVEADPFGCADKIKELIWHMENAEQAIEYLPTAQKPAEKRHDVSIELAVRVLRVLKEYGIPPSATHDAGLGFTSDAIKILKFIGDDIKLERGELTWRTTIIEAKKRAADLQ